MPGVNCSVTQCGSSRRTKGITLFKFPSAKTEALKTWRKELLSIITRDRVVDKHFQKQIDDDTVHVTATGLEPTTT